MTATRADMVETYRLVEAAWCRETSASPSRWTPERPSIGQCAVTSLIVQDRFGGLMLRSLVNGESHYSNEIDGVVWDLTADQFDTPVATGATVLVRGRAYVLANVDTHRRYDLLRGRL